MSAALNLAERTAAITHEELRKRAIKWLTNSKNCGVVLSEIHSLCQEIPDAIGWNGGNSLLVECKVSRSDFFANADKCHMRVGDGVGTYRFFLTPPGLVERSEVPDGWGLLEWRSQSSNVRLVTAATKREPNRENETIMLVSALRRVKQREFLVIVPEVQL
jgi:hypothetical protein